MKKIQFLLTFFAAALMFGLIGCQKDVTVNSGVEQFKQSERADLKYVAEYESFHVPSDKAKNRINELANALRSGNLQTRSDNAISVAEAVWNIEALTNATSANGGWKYQSIQVIQTYMALSTTDVAGEKQVSMQEVAAQYANALTAVQQAENSTNYPSANRKTIYADVVPMVDGAGGVVLQLNMGVGTNPTGCPGCSSSLSANCSATDCWKAGFKQGTCNNPPTGTYAGVADASDILENFVNEAGTPGSQCLTLLDQVAHPPTDGYFIDIMQTSDLYAQNYPNPNWQPGQPSIRRWYMYRSSQFDPEGFVDCLSVSDMDFFTIGGQKVVIKHKMDNPNFWQGKYFVDCNMSYTLLTNGTTNLLHYMRIRVGTWI